MIHSSIKSHFYPFPAQVWAFWCISRTKTFKKTFQGSYLENYFVFLLFNSAYTSIKSCQIGLNLLFWTHPRTEQSDEIFMKIIATHFPICHVRTSNFSISPILEPRSVRAPLSKPHKIRCRQSSDLISPDFDYDDDYCECRLSAHNKTTTYFGSVRNGGNEITKLNYVGSILLFHVRLHHCSSFENEQRIATTAKCHAMA